ncbi:MAG: FtsQ-type POTRA domain-containing protein [Pseudomonadota bacterium]
MIDTGNFRERLGATWSGCRHWSVWRAREWRPRTRRAGLAAVVLGAAVVVLTTAEPARIEQLRPHWPIESVAVTGELRQVSRTDLEAAIGTSLATDFFEVDVGALRAAALALPWVEDASVRRVWPNHVEVNVRERQVAARWVAGGLIDTNAQLFHPLGGRGLSLLPLLEGPDGSEAQLLERYRTLVVQLQPLEQRVVRVTLDKRDNWTVELESGLQMVLGQQVTALASTAMALRRALGARLTEAERIDLRYANGFAVRWERVPDADLALRDTIRRAAPASARREDGQ